MAYKISEECLGCGMCAEKCPAGAISDSGDIIFVIDPDKCIDCGLCARICNYEVPEPA